MHGKGLILIKKLEGLPVLSGPLAAVSRTLTAISTLLTIIYTPTEKLFAPAEGRIDPIRCDSAYGVFNVFCVNDRAAPDIGIMITIAVLILVITGMFPWLTSILHFYVTFFFQQNLAIPDGGDQVTTFLTLMFMLVFFGDRRINHWHPAEKISFIQPFTTVSGIYLIKLQMAIIYLNAAIHKMATKDWLEGSELYYLLGGSFEPSGIFLPVYRLMVEQPYLSVVSTWGAAILELFLGATLVMPNNLKKLSLCMGLIFHVAIAIFLGITSFQIVMFAGLLILCIPQESIWQNGKKTLVDAMDVSVAYFRHTFRKSMNLI